MPDTLKSASRKEWACRDVAPTHDELRTGALQRIADASEQMAKNYRQLQDERDRYERSYNQEREQRQRAERRIVALRGVITRMKRGRRN